MKPSEVHSWTSLKKCLSEIKNPPPDAGPLGSSSQLTRPVKLKTQKSRNEMILMAHSRDVLPIPAIALLLQVVVDG